MGEDPQKEKKKKGNLKQRKNEVDSNKEGMEVYQNKERNEINLNMQGMEIEGTRKGCKQVTFWSL